MAAPGQTARDIATFPAVRARLAIALAVAALGTTAGCGDDSPESNGVESKPPAQILADTAAALRQVKSFHVEATQRTGGKLAKVSADLELPSKLRLAIEEPPSAASIIAVGGAVYIKANEAYWKDQQGERAARELAGKWLKSPASTTELRDLTKGLDPETLSHCLATDHGTLAKGGTETIDGKKTVVLIDKGDRPGTTPGKLFVAATGDPLPLRTIATGNQRPGGKRDPRCDEDNRRARAGDEARFDRYDESLDIKAPPGAVEVGATGTAS